MKKRMFFVLPIICLSIAISACGKKDDPAAVEQSPPTASTTEPEQQTPATTPEPPADTAESNATQSEQYTVTMPEISEDFTESFTSDSNKFTFSYPVEFMVTPSDDGVSITCMDPFILGNISSGTENYETIDDAETYLKKNGAETTEKITIDGKEAIWATVLQADGSSRRIYIINKGDGVSVAAKFVGLGDYLNDYGNILDKLVTSITFQ